MLKSSILPSLSVITLGLCFAACSSSNAGTSGGSEAGNSFAGAKSAAGSHSGGADGAGVDVAGADSGGADSAGAPSAGVDVAGADSGGADSAGAPSAGVDVAGADSGGADSAGAPSGGSDGAGAPSGGASAGSTSSAGSGSLPAGTSSCQYSVTGGATEMGPDSPSVCSQSKVTAGYGGGFVASIGGGFQDAAGNVVALACLFSSPTAPAAGDSWTLTTASQSQGNCQLNIISNATATVWTASANDAQLIGSATLKFNSTTLTHGVYNKTDVYYFFDATLEATLPGQTAGATDVKVSGRFQLQTLPIGS